MNLPPAIRSASHPLARQARALSRTPRQRRETGLFLVEGVRGVGEAIDAGAPLVWLLVSAETVDEPLTTELIGVGLRAGVPVQPVAAGLLERLAPTEGGARLLAGCRLPAGADDGGALLEATPAGVTVLAWTVQDPGNLGTLIRSAAAFDASGLIAVEGADPWTPKAVRASAGAIHRLPIGRCTVGEALDAVANSRSSRRVAAVARGGRPPGEVAWDGRVLLLLGSEVAGLPHQLLDGAETVTIPMARGIESLSVAVAGAILLEAAARERRERADTGASP